MKKIFNILLLSVVGLCALSCEEYDAGGTATESMAGQWVITTLECYEPDGSLYVDYCEYYGCTFSVDTFNTNANIDTEMYLYDVESFWDFWVKVDIDINAMTFSATDAENLCYDSTVSITDGKIVYDAATSPTGAAADAISFTAEFSDDEGWLYAFDGYRWSGFE